jgi:peptide/nickel transport system substrate-binding protein
VKPHGCAHAGRGGPARKGPARAAALALSALLLACTALVSCSKPKRDALHVVWATDILSLDPNERYEFATDMYAMNVFEPLLRYDRRMAFSPVLATRWDIADGKTWRFHLRPGVSFHDGTPFTADDVVFTLHRILANKGSDLAPYLAALSSVRKVDDETVEIISERPAGLLSVLSYVYMLPKDALTKKGDAEFFKKPIGTGPYRYVGWTPRKSLALEAAPGWWGGAPPFSRVTLLYTEDREGAWDVAKRNSPAILMSPSRLSWDAKKSDPSFRLVMRPGMTVQYLVCNMLGGPKNPLTDLRVRKALRAAIDYQELVQVATNGQSFPASQYVTGDIVGYDPSLKVPAYVPGAAKRLLAEAGYPNGLDLTLSYSQGGSNLPKAVVRELEHAGVRIKEAPAVGTLSYDRLARCEGDLHLTGWICSTGDASELFEGNFYGHTTSGKPGGPQACGYAKPELDALIDRIAKTLDAEERRNLLQTAMRNVLEELPWIPLTVSYDRYALTAGVSFEPRADGEIYFPDVKR